MAFVDMAEAEANKVAKSAEYNNVVNNVYDLNTRVVSQATTVAQLQTDLANAGGELGGRITVLENRPTCVLRKTADQSIPTGADTTLTWSTAEVDVGSMRSGDTIVIPATGTYLIAAQANIQGGGSTAGERVIYVTQGDAHVSTASLATFAMAGNTNTSGVGTGLSTTTIRNLTAGAVLRVKVYQSSGSALAARYNQFGGCTFSVRRL